MSFQMRGYLPRSDEDNLEGGRVIAAPEDTRLLTCYSRLFECGLRASWKLFGCCTFAGLVNVLSVLLTLTETTNLRFSDMLIESNALLLSTGILISLLWRINSSKYQHTEERNRVRNELSSCAKQWIVGSFCATLISPALACLPLLAIRLSPRHGTFTSGVPLILSWVAVTTTAALPILYLGQRWETHEHDSSERYALLRGGSEDYDAYEDFDETDSPTFLPQHLAPAYHDLYEGILDQDTKAACTFTPNVSWENAVEPSEALHELIRWATSIPEESLPPSVAPELLAMAAVSIEVCLDGMGSWNQDARYTYLMSRTCDRLAEIFQQVGPSAVPEHAVNVFLLLDRFERFEGVDIAVLSADDGYIPAPVLKRIVRRLKSRSASLLGY